MRCRWLISGAAAEVIRLIQMQRQHNAPRTQQILQLLQLLVCKPRRWVPT